MYSVNRYIFRWSAAVMEATHQNAPPNESPRSGYLIFFSLLPTAFQSEERFETRQQVRWRKTMGKHDGRLGLEDTKPEFFQPPCFFLLLSFLLL